MAQFSFQVTSSYISKLWIKYNTIFSMRIIRRHIENFETFQEVIKQLKPWDPQNCTWLLENGLSLPFLIRKIWEIWIKTKKKSKTYYPYNEYILIYYFFFFCIHFVNLWIKKYYFWIKVLFSKKNSNNTNL